MGTIALRDGLGQKVYKQVSGSGTEVDPFIDDVAIQDQFSEDISLFLAQSLAMDLTINANTTLNDESVQFSAPTVAPVAGNFICFKEGVNFAQMEITNVTSDGGDDYTCDLAMPLDYAFTTAANVCLQNVDMNLDGSSTAVEFYISPEGLDAGVEWDITRMIISMTHSAAGDDSLFGGINALSKGNYFRVENGQVKNLFNAKSNSDFRNEGYDIVYPDRASTPSEFGTAARITFNGPDKRGVVKRLSSDGSDKFISKVRDNLSTLTSYRVKAQGHVVE